MKSAGLSISIFVLALACLPMSGQPSPCDQRLVQSTANPNGYRLRGDRCEGIYAQDVSGSPLFIASWTRSFTDYDPGSDKPLVIEWNNLSGAGEVRLRAQGLRRRLYYRMDAVRAAGTKSFSWNSEMLAGLNIARADIGVVGTAPMPIGGTETDVYLPLRITQAGRPVGTDGYRLVLLPGVELKEVFVTLVANSGTKPRTITDAQPLGYGYYPAGRALQIPVSGAQTRGLYHLLVAATLRSGGASSADLWFYHAGS